MRYDVTEKITCEVVLFGSIMQQNVCENEFNREYALLASIQPGMPIVFTVKNCKQPVPSLKQLALACAHKDNQSGKDKHRREHRYFNNFYALLNVLRNS